MHNELCYFIHIKHLFAVVNLSSFVKLSKLDATNESVIKIFFEILFVLILFQSFWIKEENEPDRKTAKTKVSRKWLTKANSKRSKPLGHCHEHLWEVVLSYFALNLGSNKELFRVWGHWALQVGGSWARSYKEIFSVNLLYAHFKHCDWLKKLNSQSECLNWV